MGDFDPGAGWREINEREWLQTPIDSDCVDSTIGGRHRRWVREDPKPLPTEPYTMILASWGTENTTPMCLYNGAWHSLYGNVYADIEMTAITGFEVLSEPLTAQKREDIANEDERVKAWHRVVSHPLIQPCFDTKASLIDAMLQMFDRLQKADPAAATIDAALARAEEFLDQAWTPGTMRVLSYDLQQALFAAIRAGGAS